jgi:transposase
MYTLYVGIDISATKAHVFWQHPTEQQVGQLVIEHQPKAYQRLVRQLTRFCADPQQTLLVMEATANYWLGLALFLHEQHFAVSVINPLQGKRFAQMQLRRAKTDPIDAQMLCDFARMVQPTLWIPPPIYHQLQQRLALGDDLVQSRTQ